MVKTYVLVDEKTYKRKFDPQRTRASAEGERKAAVATLPNPFQNPDARRAKQVQREMYKVGQDKSLDVDTSVRLFRRLMDEYESRISRVSGKKKRSATKKSTPRPPETSTTNAAKEEAASSTKGGVKRRRLMEGDEKGGELELEAVRGRQPLPALAKKKVPLILGGRLSKKDVEKSYPVLNEMFKAGLIKDGDSIGAIKDGSFKMSAEKARSSIRDMLLNSPDRRSTPLGDANALVNFFKKKGIQATLTRSTPRKSGRPKGGSAVSAAQ